LSPVAGLCAFDVPAMAGDDLRQLPVTLRGQGNLNNRFRLSINFYRFRIDNQLSGVT
jgi:hypothetical protein